MSHETFEEGEVLARKVFYIVLLGSVLFIALVGVMVL